MNSFFEKFSFFFAVFFSLGTSFCFFSCKSMNKGRADGYECEGKQPVTNSTKVGRASRPTLSRRSGMQTPPAEKSHSSQSSKWGETPKAGNMTGPAKPDSGEIDDEADLMKEIPRINEPGPREKAVPGVEGLIPLNGPIKIREDSANRIVDADGKDVILSGDDGVFVITGGCGKLTLNGKNNQIQCDSVNQIEISGSRNTLILGSLGGGTIRGNNNDLSWGSGIDGLNPIVESYGSDNSMKRLE